MLRRVIGRVFRVLLLRFYFACMFRFSFVSLPVVQCLFLLVGRLFIMGFLYVCVGFS